MTNRCTPPPQAAGGRSGTRTVQRARRSATRATSVRVQLSSTPPASFHVFVGAAVSNSVTVLGVVLYNSMYSSWVLSSSTSTDDGWYMISLITTGPTSG